MFRLASICLLAHLILCCAPSQKELKIQTLTGLAAPEPEAIWLSHEHILVDFIGADSIDRSKWDHDSVIQTMLPYLQELDSHKVIYFVDATPAYLGRDVVLLEKIARRTGLKIITNTGYYGARANKYIPPSVFEMTPHAIAAIWIGEFERGIDLTPVRPGFIKIGVDAADTLDPLHRRLAHAAAITHLKTGLTIASHTGEAKGLWPQLEIIDHAGVSPDAFIWVHAQNEPNDSSYLEAAKRGCWISLDGLGWELEEHVRKLVFARENDILDRILISHDAGWYDPQKKEQSIQPYTAIFTKLYPRLKENGFTEADITLLMSKNPADAYAIKVRRRLNQVVH